MKALHIGRLLCECGYYLTDHFDHVDGKLVGVTITCPNRMCQYYGRKFAPPTVELKAMDDA